jgi:hypothetical protein
MQMKATRVSNPDEFGFKATTMFIDIQMNEAAELVKQNSHDSID